MYACIKDKTELISFWDSSQLHAQVALILTGYPWLASSMSSSCFNL